MTLTVVIPTRNEALQIRDCLLWLRESFSGEILVVDGESEDGTPSLVSDCGLLQTSPGLARQCNQGAEAARGEWLFFCSADSRPIGPWLEILRQAMHSPYVVGGGFTLSLEEDSWIYRLITFGGNFRSRQEGIALGDQGLFVRRRDYLAVGGMREDSAIPFARLSFDLRKRGEFILLRETMQSSVRAYKEKGKFATLFNHVRAYSRFRRQEAVGCEKRSDEAISWS